MVPWSDELAAGVAGVGPTAESTGPGGSAHGECLMRREKGSGSNPSEPQFRDQMEKNRCERRSQRGQSKTGCVRPHGAGGRGCHKAGWGLEQGPGPRRAHEGHVKVFPICVRVRGCSSGAVQCFVKSLCR